MEVSLLIPLAICSQDISTTQKLLCTNKCVFQDINIWRLKFDYEYNNEKYLDFLTDYENYILHKINNFALLIQPDSNLTIDNLLYEYSPIYDRLFNFVAESIHYGMGYENGKFFKVEIKDRFVVFFSHDCEDFKVIGYYPSLEKALNKKNNSIKKYRDYKDYLNYIIIDLSGIKIYLIGDSIKNNPNKLNGDYYYIDSD